MGFFSKIGKKLKKLTKPLKKLVDLNPLIPGSKAQKKLSKAAKKLLPIAAGFAGGGLSSGFMGGGQAVGGGFLDDVFGAADSFLSKAGKYKEGLQEQFGYAPTPQDQFPLPQAPAPMQEDTLRKMLPWIAGGGALLLIVLMMQRRR